ncbi:hypothetical protein AB0D71_02170, partial [Streptomyces avermitilis]|uniref:hypothetical protein n=1 Tax=Streptomyces avermitilis TaxID=33903 RepID=UPI0033F4B405
MQDLGAGRRHRALVAGKADAEHRVVLPVAGEIAVVRLEDRAGAVLRALLSAVPDLPHDLVVRRLRTGVPGRCTGPGARRAAPASRTARARQPHRPRPP